MNYLLLGYSAIFLSGVVIGWVLSRPTRPRLSFGNLTKVEVLYDGEVPATIFRVAVKIHPSASAVENCGVTLSVPRAVPHLPMDLQWSNKPFGTGRLDINEGDNNHQIDVLSIYGSEDQESEVVARVNGASSQQLILTENAAGDIILTAHGKNARPCSEVFTVTTNPFSLRRKGVP